MARSYYCVSPVMLSLIRSRCDCMTAVLRISGGTTRGIFKEILENPKCPVYIKTAIIASSPGITSQGLLIYETTDYLMLASTNKC